MNGRVQRLHPPFQDLRKIGDLGHRNDRDAGIPQESRGAARRNDFDPEQLKPFGEGGEVRFI